VKLFTSLIATLALAACAGRFDPLVVEQFTLRDESSSSGDDPSVRMEKLRHLHGAVTMAERKQKLGQYYNFVWSDPQAVGEGKVELVFHYQQGSSGSLIKKMTREFPSSDASGEVEFAIIGDDYFIGGKVLTWKATLRRGNRELASRQSYLWQ